MITVTPHDIRIYSQDKHRRVDDTPYGGGAGMLMCAPPVCACHDEIMRNKEGSRRTVYMSPCGPVLTQKKAKELSEYDNIIYVNLCVNNEKELRDRIQSRDPDSYMLSNISFIYERNLELSGDVEVFIASGSKRHQNIDSTNLTVHEVVDLIIKNIIKLIKG